MNSKILFFVIAICNMFIANRAFSDDCGDIPKLRERSAALNINFAKVVNAGINGSISDVKTATARYILTVVAENYFCRIQAFQPNIEEQKLIWMNQIDESFDDIAEAITQPSAAGRITFLFTRKKERRDLISKGDLAHVFSEQTLPRVDATVAKKISDAIPKNNYIRNTTFGASAATVFTNYGGSLEASTKLINEGEIVGDLLYTLQNLRVQMVLYGQGGIKASTVLAPLINKVYMVGEQIIREMDKKGEAKKEAKKETTNEDKK
jgi:hypothetical protein